jgi:hypothetical protein
MITEKGYLADQPDFAPDTILVLISDLYEGAGKAAMIDRIG